MTPPDLGIPEGETCKKSSKRHTTRHHPRPRVSRVSVKKTGSGTKSASSCSSVQVCHSKNSFRVRPVFSKESTHRDLPSEIKVEEPVGYPKSFALTKKILSDTRTQDDKQFCLSDFWSHYSFAPNRSPKRACHLDTDLTEGGEKSGVRYCKNWA